MNEKKKKAFTLTELLVVVLILGVLSAVALPKFNRVIETRRTGEAEELLTSIRSEQEKRCSLDKPYTGYFDKLGDIVASGSKTPQTSTDNYVYTLGVKGVSAARNAKAYTLSIPSYSDGRLCCEGAYCESLNKNYPLCSSLSNVKPSNCSAPLCEVNKQCSPGDKETKNCECSSQTRTCDGECQWGPYSGSCNAKYGGTGATRGCSSGCGTQTSVSTCSGESWEGSCWSASGGGSETTPCSTINSGWQGTATRYCSATCSGSGSCGGWDTSGCSPVDPCAGKTCSGNSTQNCPAGTTGTQSRTCNCGVWSAWSGTCTADSKECSAASKPTTSQSCGSCKQTQTRDVTCNSKTGTWTSGSWNACPADPTCSGNATQSCPSGQTGTQTRTCNCGTWSAWTGTCTPKPTCSDASYKASHKAECCPSASKSDSTCWTKSGSWMYMTGATYPGTECSMRLFFNGAMIGRKMSDNCMTDGEMNYTNCSVSDGADGYKVAFDVIKCKVTTAKNGW